MRTMMLLFFACFGGEVFAQQTGWVSQNPLPTCNRINGVYAVGLDTAVTVGAIGTIAKTTNRGVTWQVDVYAGETSKTLRAVAFSGALRGIAVGDSGVILGTTDGGASWVVRFNRFSNNLLGISLPTPSLGIIVGTGGIVLRTTNGGVSWDTASSGTKSTLRGVHFIDSEYGCAVGGGGSAGQGRILQTTNGGSTWALQSISSWELNSVQFSSRDTGTIVGTFSTILRTSDGGMNWTTLSISDLATLNSVFFTDSKHGIVAGANGLARTTNGGLSWKYSMFPGTLWSTSFGNPNVGFGVGWNQSLQAASLILLTSDSGATWKNLASGVTFQLLQICAINRDVAMAVGEGGTILRTTNGGTTWTKQTTGTTLSFSGVAFTDEINGTIVASGGAFVYRTTNGGANWTAQNPPLQTGGYSDVVFPTRDVGIIVGGGSGPSGSVILRTTNAGGTWVRVPTGPAGTLKSVSFSDSVHGTSVGDGSGGPVLIFRTTNGGTSWFSQNLGVADFSQLLDVCFVDEQNGMIVGWEWPGLPLVVRTTDGGSTWVHPKGPNGISTVSGVSFVDRNIGTIVGGGNFDDVGRIFHTSDGGQTWNPQRSGSDNMLYAVSLIDASHGFAVGWGGCILKTTNGGTMWARNDPVSGGILPEKHTLLSNYPNPFNPSTTIRYGLPQRSQVTLSVFNTLGQQVAILEHGEQEAGYHEVKFDAPSLPSGMYFCRLQAGDFVQTRKLLLLQ